MSIRKWRERGLVASVLGLSGFALGSGLASCCLSASPAWEANNQLPRALRIAVLVSGIFVGLLGGSAGLQLAHKNPSRATAFAKLASPLLVLPLVSSLFSRPAWAGRELWLLFFVLLLGLVTERLLREAIQGATALGLLPQLETWVKRIPSKARRLAALVIAMGLASYYFYRVGVLTNVQHLKMATASSDLAEFDNLFFNALHAHPFRAPAIEGDLQNWSALKVHAEFGLYLLLPFYALAPGPETLLWIQSGIIALTAIPLFLLGRARLGSFAGLVIAFAYLMTPAVQRPNFYDYHFTPLGMLLTAWLLFFVFRLQQRPHSPSAARAMWTAFALALLAREDISIGLCVLGLFLMVRGKLVREGALMFVFAASYFVVMKFAIMPRFGKMWFDTIYADIKANDFPGFGAIIVSLVSNPAFVVRSLLSEPKLLYLLHMLVPVLALWLRKPVLLFALLPGFVSTLLVTNRPPMYQSSFQYTYLWVPYVFAASLLAIPKGHQKLAPLAALLLVASSLGYQYGVLLGNNNILGGFFERNFEVTEQESERLAALQRLTAKIPAAASVAATEAEGPHVSTRLVMYSLKFTLGADPEYLVVGQPRIRSEVDHLLQAHNSGNYGVISKEGPFLLLRRGADPSKNTPLLRRLGQRR